jgi:hypothetical protein
MLVQLYMYVHHTGRHERLVQPYMYITYIGHSGMNFRQANYAGLTLYVHTTYRQTQTFVKQIFLVQLYMYFHHTDRLERLSNKLFWSSSTCAYTKQANINLYLAKYTGPALHAHTKYRQTHTSVRQVFCSISAICEIIQYRQTIMCM